MKSFIYIFLISLMLVSNAFAWEPTKPVTVIFPNAPGAGNEISFGIIAKIVEEQNSKFKWKPDYRPGADGNIAMNHFATVVADGHTVAMPACQSNWVTADIWYPTIAKYNAQEFEPIATIAKSPLAFWANIDSKVNTPNDLIKLIKSKERPVMFAIGGGGHKLALEYLTSYIEKGDGTVVQSVMYKGPAQALTDVMGGHVEFSITPVSVGYPFMQAGKLKLIGIANEAPLKKLESAPLMNKSVPGLNIHGCWNLVLPKDTPVEIQQWYSENFIPAIRSKLATKVLEDNLMFSNVAEHTPAGVRASMERLRSTWQPIARKIKP